MPVNIPIRKGLFSTFFTRWQKRNGMRAAKKKMREKKKETYALISDGESRDKQCITAAFERRTTINQAQPHMKVVAATFAFSTHQKQQKPIKKNIPPQYQNISSSFFFSPRVHSRFSVSITWQMISYVSFCINILAQFLSYFFIFFARVL